MPDDGRAAIARRLREFDQHGEDLAALDRDIGTAVVDNPAVRRLLTIAGMNVTVAAGLGPAIGDIRPFPSPQKLVSYFGLNPRVRQSGLGLAQHSRISKIGRRTRGPFWSKRLRQPPGAGPLARLLPAHPRPARHQVAGWPSSPGTLLAKDTDYLWARPALVAHELRALELQAGRPMKKGNKRGPALAYNVKALRDREMRSPSRPSVPISTSWPSGNPSRP